MLKITSFLLNFIFITFSHTAEINCDLSHIPQNETAIASDTPSLEDFKKYGFIVHVGGISLTYVDKERDIEFQRPTVAASNAVTYWSFCSPTTAKTFYHKSFLFSTNAIIIKPLRSCIDRIVSVCSSEIMMAGHTPLEEGDIVIFPHRPIKKPHRRFSMHGSREHGFEVSVTVLDGSDPVLNQTFLYEEYLKLMTIDPTEFANSLKSFGIIPITYTPSHDIDDEEIEQDIDDEEIEQEQEIARLVLERIGGWHITSTIEGWWTHQTPIKINDKIVDPQVFFKNFFDEYSDISSGYEFYAKTGIGSLFRLLSQLTSKEDSEVFTPVFIQYHPEIYQHAFNFVRQTLLSYFEKAEHLSQTAKTEVALFFNRITDPDYAEKNIDSNDKITDEEFNKITLMGIFEFCSHLNKELFTNFINLIKKYITDDIYCEIIKAYTLLDNYKNTEQHETTLDLKAQLLEKSKNPEQDEFLEKIYVSATGFNFMNHQPDPKAIADWFKAV